MAYNRETVRKEIRDSILPKLKEITKKCAYGQYNSVGALPVLRGYKSFSTKISSCDISPLSDVEGFDESIQRENVKFLEHWNLDKTLTNRHCNTQKTMFLIMQTQNKQEKDLESPVLSIIREQLKYYKNKELREQLKKSKKSTSTTSYFCMTQSLRLPNDNTCETESTKRIRRIEKELAGEIRRIELKTMLNSYKAEFKNKLNANADILNTTKALNQELSNLVTRKALQRKVTVREDGLTARSTASKAKQPSLDNIRELQEQHTKYMEERKNGEKRDTSIRNLRNQLSELKKEYESNIERGKVLEQEIKEIKAELALITKTQLTHYYDILKEGKDTRNTGLMWIVKVITHLERNPPNFVKYPKYIQEETFFTISKLSTLEIVFDSLMSQKNKGLMNEGTGETPVKVEFKSFFVQRAAAKKSKEQTAERHERRLEMERQMLECHKQIKELKQKEVQRLSKVFLKSGLRKMGTNSELLCSLCAVLGDSAGEKEYLKVMAKRAEIIANLDKYKSFVLAKSIETSGLKKTPRKMYHTEGK